MKQVLFCGSTPLSGAWAIRGLQMAGMRPHWWAVNRPSQEDFDRADIVVYVKRASMKHRHALHAQLRTLQKPVVWDALDFWPQPDGAPEIRNALEARQLALQFIEQIQPSAILTSTRQMAEDLAGDADMVHCLYHHFRPSLEPCTHASNSLVYEGAPWFPAEWLHIARREAQATGWEFETITPAAGRVAPIPTWQTAAMFAARGAAHDCWLTRNWKSNVKGANALGLGVPLIAQAEAGYRETMPPFTFFSFETQDELHRILKHLRGDVMEEARRAALAARDRFSIHSIACEYEAVFDAL